MVENSRKAVNMYIESKKKEDLKMTKKKKKIGRPKKHGAYSIMKSENLPPKDLTRIREYVESAREGLIEDIAGTEDKLSTGQAILIDRTINLLSVTRMIENHASKTGTFKGNRLTPSLQQSYLSYNNTIRLNLKVLGIEPQQAGRDFDIDLYVKRKYSQKKKSPGRDRKNSE